MQNSNRLLIAVPTAAAILAAGCTSQPGEVTTAQQLDFISLTISDSIGIAMGDSNYTFGAVYAVENGPRSE